MKGLKSFRVRLLLQFLTFLLFSLLFTFLMYLFFHSREEIKALTVQLTKIHVLVSQSSKMQHEYYTYETSNSEYFESGNSDYIERYVIIRDQIENQLTLLRSMDRIEDFDISDKLMNIQNELKHNDNIFNELQKEILIRGFKDYGVEGKMRDYVHALEDYPDIIKPSDLLSMRRHEKDFILRNDSQYVNKLHAVVNQVVNSIITKKDLPSNRVKEAIHYLDKYKDEFNSLVTLEFRIGLRTNSALIGELNESDHVIDSYFYQSLLESSRKEDHLLHELYTFFFIVGGVFLILGINLSFTFARKITRPLTYLSSAVTLFIESNFRERSEIKYTFRKDEIGILARNLRILEEEIMDQINLFHQKVKDKTTEVVYQSNQIKAKNAELKEQNDMIEAQKVLVEDHNRRLLDSINYAKKIQNTILPDPVYFRKVLPRSFIYYKPKDIVSGDFYWIKRTIVKMNPSILMACVDCTGHGVPGAFMSVLGYTSLNDAHREVPGGNPGKMLEFLHKKVYEIFNKNDSKEDRLHDGMDLSLIQFFPKSRKVLYAGAYSSLFVLRSNVKGELANSKISEVKEFTGKSHTLFEIKGDRFAIGHYQEELNFFCNEIKLLKGDRMYVTTDGYSDQFGGADSKRFQKKRLRELFLELGDVSMEDQNSLLDAVLMDWKGKIEQIDDICVIGVEVK